MVMDMGRDAEQGVVELEYRPTVEDFTAALRERRRVSRAGRRQTRLVVVAFFAAGVGVAAQVAGGETPVFLPVWLVVFGFLIVLTPWLQARQVVRVAARNGVYRASVTDSGLTTRTDHSTTTIGWAAQPNYRETKNAFVVFSADRNATCFSVLPKRGLREPTDVDRLRTLLERNLTRV
jgi:hypothetical protein